MRTLQILDAVGKRIALTIRKEQVTLKLPKTLTDVEKHPYIQFAIQTCDAPELDEVVRGVIRVLQDGETLQCHLMSESRNTSYKCEKYLSKFYESHN